MRGMRIQSYNSHETLVSFDWTRQLDTLLFFRKTPTHRETKGLRETHTSVIYPFSFHHGDGTGSAFLGIICFSSVHDISYQETIGKG